MANTRLSSIKTFCICFAVFVVLTIVVALIFVSFGRLEFDEVGVGYDTTGRDLEDRVKHAGLHWGPPGFTLIEFPAVFKSIKFEELKCFTYDGAEVILDVQYQFKIFDQEIPNILRRFRNYDKYLELLKLVGQSQFYKTCSSFNAFDIVANRVEFARSSETLLRQKYDELHVLVNGLQINNIARPDKYNEAQKRKEAVRENIQVKLKERPEQLILAETEREKALAEAQIKLQGAQRQARVILTRAENQAAVLQKQAAVDAQIYLKIPQTMYSDLLMNYVEVEAISSGNKPPRVNFKK